MATTAAPFSCCRTTSAAVSSSFRQSFNVSSQQFRFCSIKHVNSSINPGTKQRVVAQCNNRRTKPGQKDSRNVLDAFFLGKALAEAVNERIGTAIGEFLSEIGRFQAEQQKRTRDFQEEVLERAKMARDKAAREAREKDQRIKAPVGSSTTVIPASPNSNSKSESSSPPDSSSSSNSTPAPTDSFEI